MIHDGDDALLFGDDASDTFLCLDEEHGTTPHEGLGIPWEDQGTHPNKLELDDTLLMDDELEDSEAIDLGQVDFSTCGDSHISSGFDSDSDHLELFEDQYLFSGALHEDDTEDQMGIPDSEGIGFEGDDQNDDQNDDRYHKFTTSTSFVY